MEKLSKNIAAKLAADLDYDNDKSGSQGGYIRIAGIAEA